MSKIKIFKKRKLILLICVLSLAITLTSCMPGNGSNSIAKPAGFFSGIWHGWIAPFSLIYSFFNSNAGIYEIYNTGFTYDLGFYIAIISGFGGIALSRKK